MIYASLNPTYTATNPKERIRKPFYTLNVSMKL
jgi:hypothetical protein